MYAVLMSTWRGSLAAAGTIALAIGLGACSALVGFEGYTGDDKTEAGGSDATADGTTLSDGTVISDGTTGSDASSDAGALTDAPADGPTTKGCNPMTAFGAPQLVTELAGGSARFARLTADELDLAFESTATSPALFEAKRAARTAPFGVGAALGVDGLFATTFDPFLGSDGLALVFSAPPDGGGARDLYLAGRADRSSDFGDVTPLVTVNSAGDEAQPYLQPLVNRLWFTTEKAIYTAPRQGTSFGAPVAVTELNTSGTQVFPVPSYDGTYMYFASDRGGNYDIYLTLRPAGATTWSAPTLVTELNSPQEDEPTWLSNDGCRLYLTSARTSGTLQIYLAERSP
jgi:hypothetical protein